MDTSTFQSTAQEGHPLTENAGSASAVGAEGYVAKMFLRGGRFCS